MTATRRLLATLIAVLVPFLVVRIGSALAGADGSTVTDGVLRLGPDGVAWLVGSALWWTAAVVAGMTAVVSGRPSPRLIARAFPVAVGALAGVGVIAALAAVLLGVILPADPVVVVLVGAVLLAVAAAPAVRLALLAPAAVVRAAAAGPVGAAVPTGDADTNDAARGAGADAADAGSPTVGGGAADVGSPTAGADLADAAGPTAGADADAGVDAASPGGRFRDGGAGRVVPGAWGRVIRILVVGVVLPALALGWLLGRMRPRGPVLGAGYFLLETVLLVAVAAVQVRALLAAHRAASGAGGSRARPTTGGAGLSRRGIALAAVALAVPAVFAGVAAAAGPLPRITTTSGTDRMAVLEGIAWPAHRHPVLVGQESIYDCADDACDGYVTTPLGVIVFAPIGGVAVAPDGGVYALGQAALAYCDPARHCRHGDTVPALTRLTAAAITPAPGGGLLIATATPVGPTSADGPSGDQVALALVYCADVDCAAPRVSALGTVPGPARPPYSWIRRMAAVTVGHDGRPVVAFRTGEGAVFVAWCVTTACDGGAVAPIDQRPAGAPDDGDLARLDGTGLIGCRTDVCAPVSPTPAIVRPGGGRYELLVEERGPDGTRVQLGRPADGPLHATLLTCRDDRCRDAVRISVYDEQLGSSNLPRPYPSEMWMLAANPDGRVVLARPDYIGHTVITVRP